MRRGFTLIEMLVVIGIITVLIAASLGGYTAITKSAEKARCQELVSNAATALSALFQNEGVWPRVLRSKASSADPRLDQDAAYALVSSSERKYFSLAVKNGKLAGNDRFGIVTPWAYDVIKRTGDSASLGTAVGKATVKDHILHFAIDLDGDGLIENVKVGGAQIDIRASAAVWCGGKDGVVGDYPYSGGKKTKDAADDIYSWSPGQTRGTK